MAKLFLIVQVLVPIGTGIFDILFNHAKMVGLAMVGGLAVGTLAMIPAWTIWLVVLAITWLHYPPGCDK
jgi:hypothetical protein